jgi:hypothetical protein
LPTVDFFPPKVLRDAATAYKVDVDAIGLKVKQEFRHQGENEAHREATNENRCEGTTETG